MKLPDLTLYHSRIARYGAGGLELDYGVAEPGCPRLYAATYHNDTPIVELPTMPTRYGSAVHAAIQLLDEGVGVDEALQQVWDVRLGPDRYGEALKDLRDLVERGGVLTQVHTLATEVELVAELYVDEDFGPIKYGGIIDYVGVGEGPSLHFADFKTNRAPISRAQVERSRQFLGYGWLVRAHADDLLPGGLLVDVVGWLEALKHYSLPVVFTDLMLDEWAAWAAAVARTILRDDDPKPRLNPGCGRCGIRSDCPAWNSLPGEGSGLLSRVANTPLARRATALVKAKETKNRLAAFIDDTEAAIRETIELDDAPFKTNTHRWTLTQGEQKRVDGLQAHQIVGDRFYDLARVSIGELEQWGKDHPEDRGAVQKAVQRLPGNVRLTMEEL